MHTIKYKSAGQLPSCNQYKAITGWLVGGWGRLSFQMEWREMKMRFVDGFGSVSLNAMHKARLWFGVGEVEAN